MVKTKPKEKDSKIIELRNLLSKRIGKAIASYNMLSAGDKIVVAVSGGKDSITLLKMLKFRQTFVPIKFDLMAVHIDFGNSAKLPDLLAKFFKKEGINYHIEKVDIFKGKARKDKNCFWCSWNRRKALFEFAAKNGFNKVALGHHFDDIIETVLLNLFYQGQISAMCPYQEMFKGKITIIRPLAYVEEDEIRKFAKLSNDFPHERCSCANSITSKRNMMAKIVKSLEKGCPQIKKNIFQSVKRIKTEYLL
jgi:Predicted ATPase of the PP-loop superfamily implicated in cell cycle control